MKKRFMFMFMPLSLIFGILFSTTAQQKVSVPNLTNVNTVIKKSEFVLQRTALSPIAKRAMQKGEKPGQFKNVSYSYTSKVRLITEEQRNLISSGMKTDGVINKSLLHQFKPSPDFIYVDPKTNLVMQFAPVSSDKLIAYKPKLNEVFKEVNIPLQEVNVTLANTTYSDETATVTSSGSDDDYNMIMHFDSIPYSFKEGKVNISLALVGDIKFKYPRVEGKFSKNGGYRLVFKAEEVADLKMYSSAKLTKELKKPIWGFEIEAGDIGKATLGVFLVINMEGEIQLQIHVNQALSMEAGAKGGTFMYAPTSLHPIININPWNKVDYKVTSKMKAFAGVVCETKLKIKGYNALNIYAKGGAEFTVETDNRHLDADMGFRVKVAGKIISKDFTLYDKYFSLWQIHQRDFGGFDMKILEACAYRDYVVGEIVTSIDKKPYTGNLTVNVKHPNGSKNSYTGKANEDGLFVIQDVPMKKGDMVSVKIPQSPNESDGVACTIPFNRINLYYADYFTGRAEGVVSAKVSKYEHLLKPQQASGHVPAGVNVSGVHNTSVNRIKNNSPAMSVQQRLDEFRKNLLIYKGPISIVAENISESTSHQSNTSHNAVHGNITKTAIPVTGNARMNVHKGITKNSIAQGLVNSPMGTFTVTNLNLKPFQKVSAKVNIEGFVIESDPVETDGILVSNISSENMKSTMDVRSKTVKADNSFVVVSALRGTGTPTGTVKLILGTDMKHSSVSNPAPKIPEIPEAVKPFTYFNKNIHLKPITGQHGVTIAETGSWTSTITYSSPADMFSPWKSSGHNFEFISYNFKGTILGKRYYQKKCAACSSPENMSKDIMKSMNKGSAGQFNVPQKINTTAPKKQPKINNTKTIQPKMNQGHIMH